MSRHRDMNTWRKSLNFVFLGPRLFASRMVRAVECRNQISVNSHVSVGRFGESRKTGEFKTHANLLTGLPDRSSHMSESLRKPFSMEDTLANLKCWSESRRQPLPPKGGFSPQL